MRYVNLVPEAKRTAPLSGNDKYVFYLGKNVEYRNRPDRKEFMKDYYAAYREEHSGYVRCDCGSVVKGISMYNHTKSKKHIDYLTSD